ncbi:DUF2268 domain-containing putative Zn-dependent protease [Vibrio parahaemolyticus]|uniref:DUF2268 domain-containing putative Zn-dependent protease n=1 Tax=Vibrio parahaemolyticus TaxID=670 RepID=UPI0022B4F104|nr:DUF2268 domain-containing putative Zn-dependent protease [Vibrio parahaemolyticus]MCZ6362916.1 DUF2268 domain-containing putative Zn-dependent protease [Vibrio parahaemolyticus]MCZ6367482.1 DUF2268 domain-containing putative Zn-dependent protease [Vibrio parahaemolyticus]
MTANITVLNSSGKLSEYSSLLENTIGSALNRISEFFELSSIDITVSPFQKGEESPSGLGGYALSEHRVELLVDCSRSDIDEVIETELLEVLAHELHHALRLSFHMPTGTLLQQLIMEGLACHFEHSVTNGKPSSLFKDLANYDWRFGLEQMHHLLETTDFSLDKLFLGSHPKEFPKYAGYWIGYNLVAEYARANNATEVEMVGLNASCFLNVE